MQHPPPLTTPPQHHQATSMGVPRLLPDLRLALASLYSLPVPPGQQLPSPNETHDFLMLIQSRNVRRRIRSIQQRHRDQGQHSSNNNAEEMVHMGSSWLACLALLCQIMSHNEDGSMQSFAASSTERLFAAQTLLHRLRRVKLVEGVDLELEAWSDTCDRAWLLQCYQEEASTASHATNSCEHLVANYQQWMVHSCGNRFVGQVLHDHRASLLDYFQPGGVVDEEWVKAELTILTLAATAFLQACDRSVSEHERTPLLTTTVSALATATFRLRYDVVEQNTGSHRPPLVSLIHHAFQLVWKTASTDVGGNTTNYEAWTDSLLTCLAILPDAILGSPGGARGRLSVDPRGLRAASQDLRTIDTPVLADILLQQQRQQQQHHHHHQQQNGGHSLLANQHANDHDNNNTNLWILQTSAKWATFLPLTMHLMQMTIPLVNQYLTQRDHQPSHQCQVALAFLIAVYESGSWTVDQIVSSAMGMSDQQMTQQQTKKKQSTRSKKRQKERIENNSTQSTVQEAQAEKHLRGEIACQGTMQCWVALSTAALSALTEAAVNERYQVEGEGPIGCLAACANACLPHILRNPASPHGLELFTSIADAFHPLCASPQKTIRALALEPLYTLHTVLLDVLQTTGPLENPMESIVVDHFYRCSISIALACGYPPHYFAHLSSESDHELEVERNDARDLLRTVSGSGEGGSTVNSDSNELPLEITTRILAKIVEACKEAIMVSTQGPESFPEQAVHALSSLAKPVNHLSKCYATYGGTEDIRNILGSVLQALVETNRMAVAGFHQNLPLDQLLPLSRLVNIANASFAPFLAALASIQVETIATGVAQMLDVAIHGSILSLEHIPELCAPSILDHSQYDIRGTMRGPGGEDHVGCLTLMRLAFEGDDLGRMMVLSCAPYMSRLCDLLQTLKQIEVERGKTVLHGRGVTPQTRRILVGALCRLELISQAQLGASAMLSCLFSTAITAISQFQPKTEFHEQELFEMTESTLDLASFSPTIVASLFQPTATADDPPRTACLEVLTTACVHGYKRWSATDTSNETILQWNRFRAALFLLLRKASVSESDICEWGAAIISACVAAECEVIHLQCAAGPSSMSSLFTDDVISPDPAQGVPAGLFIRCIAEILQCRSHPNGHKAASSPNCIQALNASKTPVLTSITLPCSDPRDGAFIDPRPTVCEAWLQAMIELAESNSGDPTAEALLVETCATVVSLLFVPSMGRTQGERIHDACMSLDGPHSLALTTFLSTFFRLGASALDAVGQMLVRSIPIDHVLIQGIQDQNLLGVAVVGAALFRACQGALPPWAVESIPEVYSSFFEACGQDAEAFGLLMRLSMEVRLQPRTSYGGIGPARLLSGRFFENMPEQAKTAFIDETKELCKKGGMVSWKRLKVLIKQACGGKKRDAEFNQKPAATRWEFDRV